MDVPLQLDYFTFIRSWRHQRRRKKKTIERSGEGFRGSVFVMRRCPSCNVWFLCWRRWNEGFKYISSNVIKVLLVMLFQITGCRIRYRSFNALSIPMLDKSAITWTFLSVIGWFSRVADVDEKMRVTASCIDHKKVLGTAFLRQLKSCRDNGIKVGVTFWLNRNWRDRIDHNHIFFPLQNLRTRRTI